MAELVLAGGVVADVRRGRVEAAAVAISGSQISAVGPEDTIVSGAREVIDVRGGTIVPGYIEPHTHIVVADPVAFAGAVLARGTTLAVADALPLMALVRDNVLAEVLTRLAALPMKLRWLIRLHPQTFGEDPRFHLEHLRTLWRHPATAAVGEVTRWVDLLGGEPDLRAKIEAARADGLRVEGHAAGASYDRLTALAALGFTSDHEAVTAQDVTNRLRAGLYTMLRHSSIRPDLPALARAVTDGDISSGLLMLTADGPTPAFIDQHGYMDHVLDVAIRAGIAPLAALRMATLNPAAYYGFEEFGEVAVGKRADLNVLADLRDPYPLLVIADGRVAAREGTLVAPLPPFPWAEHIEPLRVPPLDAAALAAPEGSVVLRLIDGVITDRVEAGDATAASLHVALIDRAGRWITRGRLAGFVRRLGGLATTISSGFDILVMGQHPADMARALRRLGELGGGIVIVEDGEEIFSLPLNAIFYSSRPWSEVVEANRRFNALIRGRGYEYNDPIFVPLFLTFDSLPWIRMTSRGIWDVRDRRVLAPSVPL